MVVKLAFNDFIRLYLSPDTYASSRDVIPCVDDGVLLELYHYTILGEDDKTYTHPHYTDVGVDAYVRFMQDMQQAFIDKTKPC